MDEEGTSEMTFQTHREDNEYLDTEFGSLVYKPNGGIKEENNLIQYENTNLDDIPGDNDLVDLIGDEDVTRQGKNQD